MAELILYASIASRSFIAFWMMEEIGVDYEWRETDLRRRDQKTPEYLRINPQGRVPTLVIDGQVVTERPAICAILADRFSYGDLAPRIEDPLRGPYYKWLLYAGAVLDPAILLARGEARLPDKTWGDLPEVVAELTSALTPGPFILGERFSAADVALGSVIAMALFNQHLPPEPALQVYVDRLNTRPALQRAMA